MRTSIVAIPIAAALVGCATPAEQAVELEQEVEQMVRIYGPACQKLGFNLNTDPWRNCIINLSQKDAMRYSSNYYGPYWRYPYPYWAY